VNKANSNGQTTPLIEEAQIKQQNILKTKISHFL